MSESTTPPVTTAPAPSVPETVVVDQSVAKTAHRIARTKTFLKSTFKTVGVPTIVGATAALVVNARNNRNDEDGDLESSNDTSAS